MIATFTLKNGAVLEGFTELEATQFRDWMGAGGVIVQLPNRENGHTIVKLDEVAAVRTWEPS